MSHIDDDQKDLIAAKVAKINMELTAAGDGLPPASISVGISHGKDAEDVNSLFEKTDRAMYRSKRIGKHTFTFSSDKDR